MSFNRRRRPSRPHAFVESIERRLLLATHLVLNTDDSGAGSLREAILDMNSGDTLDLTQLSGTITLNSSLSTNKSFTLLGPGSDALSISGNDSTGIFYLTNNVVTVNDVTIRNGRYNAGGALTSFNTDATFNRVVFRDNHSKQGGAIYFAATNSASENTLTLTDSRVINNVAATTTNYDSATGGGILVRAGGGYGSPGAIASLNITGSTIADNIASSEYGGASLNGAGIALRAEGLVSSGEGGVIHADIRTSTISGNIATTTESNSAMFGGGIYAIGGNSIDTTGSSVNMHMENVTIANNAVISNGVNSIAHGGGLYLQSGGGIGHPNAGGNLSFNAYHTTIAANQATDRAAGVFVSGFAGINGGNGNTTFTPTSTLIAGNINQADIHFEDTHTTAGGLYNLFGTVAGSIAPYINGVNNNLVGVDPMLGTFGDHGGPTQTFSLLAGSPAIDTADTEVAPATDQRGVAREGAADIGAYEYVTPITWTAPVSLADRTLTIRGTEDADYVQVWTRNEGTQVRVDRNGVIKNYNRADIDAIFIDTLDGDDTIIINVDTLGVTAYGGKGADTIRGGSGDDTLGGGGGNDVIYGGPGNDIIRGHGGADRLFGENGEDRLYGGDGKDTLDGGRHRDRLWGEGHFDVLHSRNDGARDRLYGGATGIVDGDIAFADDDDIVYDMLRSGT